MKIQTKSTTFQPVTVVFENAIEYMAFLEFMGGPTQMLTDNCSYIKEDVAINAIDNAMTYEEWQEQVSYAKQFITEDKLL